MAEDMKSIRVGAATITLINIGNLGAEFTEDGHHSEIPIQCVLIQLPETVALVDASVYDIAPDSQYAIPGYQPPPSLIVRLGEAGITPEQVRQVIITHTHFDHINGLTEKRGGKCQPSFPNARYYMGRADWENPEMQQELKDADSLASRTLGVLDRAGLLERVDARRDLGSGIEIIPAPGETPGHQIVRVQSEGETFYCLGDLYHDAFEVEHPERMVEWADATIMGGSRSRLTEAALGENARLTATHIPTIGRLERTSSGVIWKAI